MDAWPSTLPQAPFRNFGVDIDSGLLEPDEKNNPIRTRTYQEHEASFRFTQLTVAQLQALRTFYNVTLNQCAPFSAPWLSALGFDFHFLRFTDPPAFAKNGKNWDVDIKVEIIAGVPMADGFVSYWLPED